MLRTTSIGHNIPHVAEDGGVNVLADVPWTSRIKSGICTATIKCFLSMLCEQDSTSVVRADALSATQSGRNGRFCNLIDDSAAVLAGSPAGGTAHQDIWRAAAERLPPVAVCFCPAGLSGCVVARLFLLELYLRSPRLPTPSRSSPGPVPAHKCLELGKPNMTLFGQAAHHSQYGTACCFTPQKGQS